MTESVVLRTPLTSSSLACVFVCVHRPGAHRLVEMLCQKLRVTGDCPLLNSRASGQVLGAFAFGGYDYVSNTPDAGTDGWDTEVFSFKTLERVWREASSIYDREHVTPFIRTSSDFRTRKVVSDRIPGEEKWSVDTPEDLETTYGAITETLELVASVKDPAELVEGPIVSHPFRAMTP